MSVSTSSSGIAAVVEAFIVCSTYLKQKQNGRVRQAQKGAEHGDGLSYGREGNKKGSGGGHGRRRKAWRREREGCLCSGARTQIGRPCSRTIARTAPSPEEGGRGGGGGEGG